MMEYWMNILWCPLWIHNCICEAHLIKKLHTRRVIRKVDMSKFDLLLLILKERAIYIRNININKGVPRDGGQ
jgi:hypothetical protein